MKTILTAILLMTISNFVVSQHLKFSEVTHTPQPDTLNQEQPMTFSYLSVIDDSGDTLSTFNSFEMDGELEYNIERVKTGLKDFPYVSKVQFTVQACCSSIETQYYLKNEDKQLVKLNALVNTHCDGPEPFYDYIFPNDKFGIPDAIIKAKLIYNKQYEL